MTKNNTKTSLTPSQIVQELNKHIIGQAEAKKKLAIGLRNRWRREQVEDATMRKEIKGENILMIGNTGSGKTECARRIADLGKKQPFIKVEATKYTEVGYMGRNVEEIPWLLVKEAYNIVKQERAKEVKEKAIQRVEKIILDKLIPPLSEENETLSMSPTSEEAHLNAQTRANFLAQIKKDTLDHREIEVELEQESPTGIGFMGHGMIDESSMMNLQNMLKKMLPKNIKKRKMTIKLAKKILLEQEKNKLIDTEAVKEEALQRAAYEGIIFIDEIDKIASSIHNSHSPDVSKEGVQRDLLPLIEGCTVSTPYGAINTEHILFIAAGAFHTSKPSDLIPELQGRFPIRVQLDTLTEQDFYDILQNTENSIIKRAQALFLTEGVELTFEEEAIKEIAHQAFTINQNIENIGARRLHTVMSYLLDDFLFDMPDKIGRGEAIKITKELVMQRLAKPAQEKDLSEYIL